MYDWMYDYLAFGSVFMVILVIIILISSIAAYILISIGLYHAAQKRGIPNPWMAWVPLTRDYLLGALLKNELVVTKKFRIPYLQFVLPAATIMTWITRRGFFSGLFTLVAVILTMLAISSLFRQYKDSNAILYGILTCLPITCLIGSLFVYQLGMKDPPDLSVDATVFPTA